MSKIKKISSEKIKKTRILSKNWSKCHILTLKRKMSHFDMSAYITTFLDTFLENNIMSKCRSNAYISSYGHDKLYLLNFKI